MDGHETKSPKVQGIKLTQIGNSVGLILPKEVLARLKLEKGDTVYLTDAPGGVTLTPHDDNFSAENYESSSKCAA
jgi:putative addiction module antidote